MNRLMGVPSQYVSAMWTTARPPRARTSARSSVASPAVSTVAIRSSTKSAIARARDTPENRPSTVAFVVCTLRRSTSIRVPNVPDDTHSSPSSPV